jgi:hypothetical protein
MRHKWRPPTLLLQNVRDRPGPTQPPAVQIRKAPPVVKRGSGVRPTIRLRLVPGLWMGRAKSPLPLQAFLAYKANTLPSPLHAVLH